MLTLKSDLSKISNQKPNPVPLGDGNIATIENQLGIGSNFSYIKDKHITSKIFTPFGYNVDRKYSGKLLIRSTEENSPSAIVEQYKKFNLREESYNTSFDKQPYILRGIQRKDKQEPQFWGMKDLDDGLIRGGMTTVLERTEKDLERIGKWMISPRGLMWQIKQVGLALTNPKIETVTGIRDNRLQVGSDVLLSVAGAGIGLHFKRQGVPILNEFTNYENTLKVKRLEFDAGITISNRLVGLKKELGINNILRSNADILTLAGNSITSLSGIGGAQSMLGQGVTLIHRVTKSTPFMLYFPDDVEYSYYRAENKNITTGYNSSIKFKKIRPGKEFFSGNNADTRDVDSRLFTPKSLVDKASANFEENRRGNNERAKDYPNNPYNPNFDDKESQNLIKLKTYADKMIAGNLRAKTLHDFDANKDELKQGLLEYDELDTSLKSKISNKDDLYNTGLDIKNTNSVPEGNINNYITLSYNKIKKLADDKMSYKDFRTELEGVNGTTLTEAEKGISGQNKSTTYYKDNNLHDKFGIQRSKNIGESLGDYSTFLVGSDKFKGKKTDRDKLSATSEFRGDKITALDIVSTNKDAVSFSDVYPNGVRDFIKFYFEDGDLGYNVMPFRATLTGFSDSFTPGWNRIDMMGRPDGAYLYSSFERSISFTFNIMAMSRSEMIPMWRKLNYLASYTMPDFTENKGRPAGPFMRITIGSLFEQTPGFIESLTYSIPEDATWDIAEDADNPEAKQLPMLIEAAMTFRIVADHRPQQMGRVYSLSPYGHRKQMAGQWLPEAKDNY